MSRVGTTRDHMRNFLMDGRDLGISTLVFGTRDIATNQTRYAEQRAPIETLPEFNNLPQSKRKLIWIKIDKRLCICCFLATSFAAACCFAFDNFAWNPHKDTLRRV